VNQKLLQVSCETSIFRWQAKTDSFADVPFTKHDSRTKILDAPQASRQTLKASIKLL
jgi:hypothetical protein